MTPGERALVRDASAHVLVDDPEVPDLPDDAAHHLFRVLRLRNGEPVTLTDGRGRWCPARVADDAVVADGELRVELPPDSPLTIAVAVPKRDRPEWIVQKLTELGVSRIVMLHTDRSVVRWEPGRAAKHLAKLRRVAAEALQQSRGVWLPTIEGPVEGRAVLPESVVAEPGGREQSSGDRVVAIGPEGGWSDPELALARDRITLGSTILRVETAALVVAARALAHVK